MQNRNGPITPEYRIADFCASRAVLEGRVIRRSLRDIDRHAGRAAFQREAEKRGYRAVENTGQLVIFCNREPFRRVCQPFSRQKIARTLLPNVSYRKHLYSLGYSAPQRVHPIASRPRAHG